MGLQWFLNQAKKKGSFALPKVPKSRDFPAASKDTSLLSLVTASAPAPTHRQLRLWWRMLS